MQHRHVVCNSPPSLSTVHDDRGCPPSTLVPQTARKRTRSLILFTAEAMHLALENFRATLCRWLLENPACDILIDRSGPACNLIAPCHQHHNSLGPVKEASTASRPKEVTHGRPPESSMHSEPDKLVGVEPFCQAETLCLDWS